MSMRSVLLVLGLLALSIQGGAAPEDTSGIPTIMRESRGVWVATVGNIDWPSKPGLSTEQQQQEAIAILDKCVELNMNQVVYQVRPACDSMYDSKLEPWSEYLTGEQGKAPDPYYDPLEFWVAESHKRGLELHCWFNPYRARLLGRGEKTTAENHISKTHPQVVKTYGTYQWMDPGEKIVQDQTVNVIMDVVKRYDVDGIHMDDYFYPYPINETTAGVTREKDFPDDDSWARYEKSGGDLSRNDWRRENVNKLVQRLYREIKDEKPYVKFGLSPFGIWKPGFPAQIAGFNQYEKLYADAKLWLERGWVDYYTPQLYWPIAKPQQSYPVLLKWWVEQNKKNRHIWPGIYTGKFAGDVDSSASQQEIPYQIEWTRLTPGASGNIHFSMKVFMRNPADFNERLTDGVYAQQAIVPAFTWLDDEPPAKPSISLSKDADRTEGQLIQWKGAGEEPAWLWAVYTGTPGKDGARKWRTAVKPTAETSMTLTLKDGETDAVVAVSAIDRNGNESAKAVLKLGGSAGQ